MTSIFKNNTYLREFTPRAIPHRLPLVAMLRRYRDPRGGGQNAPSPNGARCSADPNGARVKGKRPCTTQAARTRATEFGTFTASIAPVQFPKVTILVDACAEDIPCRRGSDRPITQLSCGLSGPVVSDGRRTVRRSAGAVVPRPPTGARVTTTVTRLADHHPSPADGVKAAGAASACHRRPPPREK